MEDSRRTLPVKSGLRLKEEIELPLNKCEFAGWWLTQASLIVKTNGATILIDPWWRDLAIEGRWSKLLGEFPLSPEEFPRADVILCTHWHDDHMDPVLLPMLAKLHPNTPIVVPSRSLELALSWGIPAEQLIGMDGNDSVKIRQISIQAIPAAHEELDIDEEGKSLYLGYMVESDGVTLFHMGDSKNWDGWVAAINEAAPNGIDVAFLCINGNDNLDHHQAVDLCNEITPSLVVPIHYGMDPNNTIDPMLFIDELESKLPNQHHHLPLVGRAFMLKNT